MPNIEKEKTPLSDLDVFGEKFDKLIVAIESLAIMRSQKRNQEKQRVIQALEALYADVEEWNAVKNEERGIDEPVDVDEMENEKSKCFEILLCITTLLWRFGEEETHEKNEKRMRQRRQQKIRQSILTSLVHAKAKSPKVKKRSEHVHCFQNQRPVNSKIARFIILYRVWSQNYIDEVTFEKIRKTIYEKDLSFEETKQLILKKFREKNV